MIYKQLNLAICFGIYFVIKPKKFVLSNSKKN